MDNTNQSWPIFSPGEEVRLELLQYADPNGLHDVERMWRQLCRKLLGHVQMRDQLLIAIEKESNVRRLLTECKAGTLRCLAYENCGYIPLKLPEPFRKK